MITRPAADAAATADQVQALGWVPVIAPLLSVRLLQPDWPAMVDAVVVTSGNALPGLQAFKGDMLLAVGDATAARARAMGFSRVRSAGGDAVALAGLVGQAVPRGGAVLLPTAEGEGLPLTGWLEAAGYVVQRRIAYRVDPVADMPEAAAMAFERGSLRAALFLSARTARVFTGLLHPALHPKLQGIEALAIGQPAADQLNPLPWARVRVPLAPTLDQVLALL